MLTSPDKRSKEEASYLESLVRDINAFKKYPDELRESLASEVRYQYLPAGRTVIRQEHKAKALYYIVKGQLQIYRNVTNTITGITLSMCSWIHITIKIFCVIIIFKF